MNCLCAFHRCFSHTCCAPMHWCLVTVSIDNCQSPCPQGAQAAEREKQFCRCCCKGKHRMPWIPCMASGTKQVRKVWWKRCSWAEAEAEGAMGTAKGLEDKVTYILNPGYKRWWAMRDWLQVALGANFAEKVGNKGAYQSVYYFLDIHLQTVWLALLSTLRESKWEKRAGI